MKPKAELFAVRKTIGASLLSLRNKNESPEITRLTKENLSLALRLQAKILLTNPELKPIRVRQTNLFSVAAIKEAFKNNEEVFVRTQGNGSGKSFITKEDHPL